MKYKAALITILLTLVAALVVPVFSLAQETKPKAGEQRKVPLIVGANQGEAMLQNSVPEMANMHAKTGTPTWVYRDVLYWGQDRLDFLDEALSS